MKKKFFIIPACFTLAFLCAEARVQNDSWSTFEEGSWVVMKESDIRGSDQKTHRVKTVKSGLIGRGTELLRFTEEAGGFDTEPRRSTTIPGASIERLPGSRLDAEEQDTLSINASEYNCILETYVLTRPGSSEGETWFKLWKSEGVDIPYRELSLPGPDFALDPDVLRIDFSIKGPGGTQSGSLKVVSLEETIGLDGEVLTCVMEEAEMTMDRRGSEMSATLQRWLSSQVPGHTAKLVSEINQDGTIIKHEEIIEEYGVTPK